jgi:hypothetical protein
VLPFVPSAEILYEQLLDRAILVLGIMVSSVALILGPELVTFVLIEVDLVKLAPALLHLVQLAIDLLLDEVALRVDIFTLALLFLRPFPEAFAGGTSR